MDEGFSYQGGTNAGNALACTAYRGSRFGHTWQSGLIYLVVPTLVPTNAGGGVPSRGANRHHVLASRDAQLTSGPGKHPWPCKRPPEASAAGATAGALVSFTQFMKSARHSFHGSISTLRLEGCPECPKCAECAGTVLSSFTT